MIMSIILLVSIFVVLCLIFGSIALISSLKKGKNTTLSEGENFEKKVRTIYFYMIMIILIVISIVGIIGVFSNLMDIYLPENISSLTKSNLEKAYNIEELCTSITAIVISIPLFAIASKKVKEK